VQCLVLYIHDIGIDCPGIHSLCLTHGLLPSMRGCPLSILACHRMLKLYVMQLNLSWLLQVLQERLQASGMPLEPYAAYLDIREYGTVPHSGFGLGFERLILFATGLENIREAIPFPRWPGHAEC